MIFDLNTTQLGDLRDGYDVCIAGAGVAGITLASELAALGRRVLLLEAGGLDFTEQSQDVYRGRSTGRPYFELHESRLRYLGGTSNHWAGWCRPLDAHDFEKRDHIPDSGWPFGRAELDPYLARTSRILEIPPTYDDRVLEDSDNAFRTIEFQHSPPVVFSEKYGPELKDSKRIDLVLNANLLDIRLTENTDRAAAFLCANYADPSRRHAFAGKAFVLAMGGIENPRMLLNFRSQVPGGIGNARDLVGRYFMEHFHALGGYYATDEEAWPFGDGILMDDLTRAKHHEVHLAPTPAFMAEQGIVNAGLRVGPMLIPGPSLYSRVKQSMVCSQDIVREFIRYFHRVGCPSTSYVGGYLRVASEQAPNRNSRVTLSEETDLFGLRRVALDWRVTEIDRRTIRRMVIAFGRYLAERRYGNVKLVDWLLDDGEPIPGVGQDDWLGAGWHHMGTTRMARTPAEGVVDRNCRVFGVGNLFVAGSSVFPTGGHANPTFTIVQLTLRLGEHIDRALES